MNQLRLFNDIEDKKGVNVATVPMRSPFRYPGGKTWLIPYIRKWLKSLDTCVELIEPFAGGGIVGLTTAFENLAKKVILVEKDEDIAAVWETILGTDGKWLAEQIEHFELTKENINKVFDKQNKSLRHRAFVTILRNRLNRGGILAAGAGMIKNGENGKGLKSRWYPATLKKRILDIQEFRDKIDFLEDDGLEIIKQYLHKKTTAFFIDPPYTVAGRRLYRYSKIDNKLLFDLAAKISGDFLITYDEAEEIKLLAEKHGFELERILMKTTHHRNKYELLISRNLQWFRELDMY